MNLSSGARLYALRMAAIAAAFALPMLLIMVAVIRQIDGAAYVTTSELRGTGAIDDALTLLVRLEDYRDQIALAIAPTSGVLPLDLVRENVQRSIDQWKLRAFEAQAPALVQYVAGAWDRAKADRPGRSSANEDAMIAGVLQLITALAERSSLAYDAQVDVHRLVDLSAVQFPQALDDLRTANLIAVRAALAHDMTLAARLDLNAASARLQTRAAAALGDVQAASEAASAIGPALHGITTHSFDDGIRFAALIHNDVVLKDRITLSAVAVDQLTRSAVSEWVDAQRKAAPLADELLRARLRGFQLRKAAIVALTLFGISAGGFIALRIVRRITARHRDELRRSREQAEYLAAQLAREKAERALTLTEARVIEILESLSDAFIALGGDLRITYVNGPFLNWAGLPAEHYVGQSYRVLFDEFPMPAVEDRLLEAARARRPTRIDYYYAPRERWYEARIFPSREGVSIYFRDITRRKSDDARIRALNEQLEARVLARTAELEYANKELEAFSYSVSHDLRAPLRAIEGFGQALDEDYGAQLDATARNYLDRIRKATLRMAALIDALLELARVSRATLTSSKVDLCEIARSVCADLQAADEAAGVERHVELCIADPLPAWGDRALLSALMQNLLGNAWKFTRHQPAPRIEVGMSDDGTFFVRDNGCGFDQAYERKLFGAFARLHGPDEYEGTGIGLATVSRIISRHGGKIWARGVPDEGATFFFTLPAPTPIADAERAEAAPTA